MFTNFWLVADFLLSPDLGIDTVVCEFGVGYEPVWLRLAACQTGRRLAATKSRRFLWNNQSVAISRRYQLLVVKISNFKLDASY
jgi:hypothetical protein